MKKLLLIMILVSLAGCRTIERTVYVDRWRDMTKTDSVYITKTDSIDRFVSGDTVYLNRWRTEYQYKYKYINKIDSFIKLDTISTVRTEIKTVYKNKFGFLDTVGIAFFIILFLLVVFILLRLKPKLGKWG